MVSTNHHQPNAFLVTDRRYNFETHTQLFLVHNTEWHKTSLLMAKINLHSLCLLFQTHFFPPEETSLKENRKKKSRKLVAYLYKWILNGLASVFSYVIHAVKYLLSTSLEVSFPFQSFTCFIHHGREIFFTPAFLHWTSKAYAYSAFDFYFGDYFFKLQF